MERFNQLIEIIQGKKEGQGEDSFCFNCSPSPRPDMISIFDGCGGSGAKRYEKMGNHTGAYIASRIASGVVFDWFKNDYYEEDIQLWTSDIKEKLQNMLKKYKRCDTSKVQFKGNLLKDFPTTMSGTVIFGKTGDAKALYMWAGDSKGYLLNSTGLHQITKDDIKSDNDAMTNLKDDGVLSNVISASGDFNINDRLIKLQEKSMIICASDGCFGYLESPIHFEYMLLRFLEESTNMNEWKIKIVDYLEKVSGDDFSMLIYIYGFDTFADIQQQMYQRCVHIEQDYISNWTTLSDEQKGECWVRYSRELSGV